MIRERIEAALQEVGLNLLPGGDEGQFTIGGDTYPHRELLKRHGARWSATRRCWVIALTGPGLAETAAPFIAAPAVRPHYHGHRERLRNRLREAGPGALADYELLELLLFFSVHRRDTKPIAKAMLERFGSLGGVLAAEPARYREFMGIPAAGEGELHAVRGDDLRFTQVLLAAIHDLLQRVLKEDVRAREAIRSPETLRAYLQVAMRHETTEHLRILFLDRKDQLIRDEVQGRGTVDQAPLYPREVVKRALELGASAVVLVHNHPSGDPTPSRADIDSTRQVAGALAQVGIALHDHLIVGSERIESLRDLGVVG